MKTFRKAYDSDSQVSRSTCEGSRYYIESRVIFDPDGNMHLEAGKQRDRVAEIQSYKDSCDVNVLIKRYQNGDAAALMRDNTGVFCDISSMPRNVHEAVKLSRDVESVYNSMGDDIKSFYPTVNDFSAAFVSSSGLNQFIKNVQKVVKVRADKLKNKADKLNDKEDLVNA